MLLKNAKNAILYLVFNYSSFQYYKMCDGTFSDDTVTTSVFTTPTISTSGSGQRFIVGNGTTKETEEDYKLESEITDITINSFTLTETGTQSGEILNHKASYRAVVTNDTTEDMTISEIGIKKQTGPGAVTENNNFLMYRKTIDPITLAPGETYAFAIDLT